MSEAKRNELARPPSSALRALLDKWEKKEKYFRAQQLIADANLADQFIRDLKTLETK